MHDMLIGYLLDALEAEESEQVEQLLGAEADLRRDLELLRLALVPLEGDRTDVEAPGGLAHRTCRLILSQRGEL